MYVSLDLFLYCHQIKKLFFFLPGIMNVLRRPFLNITQMFLPQVNKYHSLSLFITPSHIPVQHYVHNLKQSVLLQPNTVLLEQPVCGFKFKGVVKKRCKDCYIVVKDRQQIVLCKTHPRHKQKQIMPKEKDTWIITHRTYGRIRPW